MSVPEQKPIVVYKANGSTTKFPITFDLHDTEQLFVVVNNEVPEVGAYTVLNKEVVFAVAPENGDEITVSRMTALEREIDYKSFNNSFRPQSLNWDFNKIWHVLQESNLIDAKILSRLKEEIEWRRTHNFNYDTLAQVRDLQIFESLKSYLDTILASTTPNIFCGVNAGVVFADDKKSLQTHLEKILSDLEESASAINDEETRATQVEQLLNSKIESEIIRATTQETHLMEQIASVTSGVESFATEVELLASTPILEKKAAKALDTKKVWLWQDEQWIDTGLSELDLAKSYSDTNFQKNRADVIANQDLVLLNEVGDYLIPPLTALINAPSGRTLAREAVLTVSGVGTSNRYRKQEYSETVSGKKWFQIIDTTSNTVRRPWTDVSIAGREEIVSSLSYRELCRVVASRTNSANSYTQEARDSGLLRGLIQGEIIYDSVNRKVYTPSSLIVYDSVGVMYTVTTAQTVGVTETDFGTHNMFMLYFDKSTLSFSLLSYRTALTDTQKANFILCATIRHDEDRLSIISDGLFRIDYAQDGEIISKQYADVYGAASREFGNLPNYDTSLHQLELKKNTLIKFGNINYTLTDNVLIQTYDPYETSSVVIVYFNLVTSEFVVKKYNTYLSINERFRLVKIASIRDNANNGNSAAGRDVVSINIECQFTIDNIDPFSRSSAVAAPVPYRSIVNFVNVDDTVRGINHGGFKSIAPANSLEGYSASKAAGFRYVECDVKFTSDGVPILMHDDTVDRTTNGTGAVRDMTLAQIKALRIDTHPDYSDCQVPTLEEFLRHCHRLNLHPYIEWSEVNSEPTDNDASLIAQIIRRTGMSGKVTLISMRNDKLAAVCKYMPYLRCGCTTSSVPTLARISSYLKTINDQSGGLNEVFYNCKEENLTQELVNNCHDMGVGCEAWVVNDAARALELASWGVTGITTDSLNIREILDS